MLLPDVRGELSRPLELLADLLADVRTWSDEQVGARSALSLPGMLVAHGTLQSVRRLLYLVESTQCRPAGAACVYGPGRRDPHTVLRPLQLPALDVEALSLTARVLGHPALPAPLRDLVTSYAGVGVPDESRADAGDLVARLAGLAGLLAPCPVPAARMLAARLLVLQRREEPSVLTYTEEAAYQAVLAHINLLWTASSPRHRPFR
ncbi:hypothetical protein ACI79P_14770 [Blastococcus sp. SYSU DS0510]